MVCDFLKKKGEPARLTLTVFGYDIGSNYLKCSYIHTYIHTDIYIYIYIYITF